MFIMDHYVSGNMVFWIVIGVIAVAGIYFNYRESVHRNKTLQILAEKGQPIPPDFFRESRHHYRSGRGGVARGIMLMAVGVALFIFLSGLGGFVNGVHMEPRWLPLVGIFPFMIGLATLVGALFERREPPESKN